MDIHNVTEADTMVVFVVSFLFFLLIDAMSGLLTRNGALTMPEMGVNIFAFGNFLGSRIFITAFWTWLFFSVFESGQGFLTGANFWVIFAVYTLIEEYAHYWIHRLSHQVPWLWRIHKAHHTPEHLHVAITYRENWLWWALAPNTYITAFFVWAGQAEPVLFAVCIKIVFGFLTHCGARWDLPLHNYWLTKPIMRVLEKVVTMQDTHHAHHGIGKYGNGMCNFAPYLFIFDVLHGTAVFPRHTQEAYGVPKTVKIEPWYELLWWPMAKAAAPADLHPPTKAESEAQSRIYTSTNGRVTVTM